MFRKERSLAICEESTFKALDMRVVETVFAPVALRISI